MHEVRTGGVNDAVQPGGPGEDADVPVDGRRLRSVQTRKAIVDAVISLQERGHPRASAAQIAEEAGVSPRSIFIHFMSQEGLTMAVMDEIERRHMGVLAEQTPDRGFEARLKTFVNRRATLLDKLVLYRRSAAVVQSSADAVVRRRRHVRLRLREEVAVMFRPELQALGSRRAELALNAAAALCESEAWDTWRHTYGMSERDSKAALQLTLEALLKSA
ncbi:MAG: TetR/AcrR family transcriptional regulator [Pseudorhodoplanes sp.]